MLSFIFFILISTISATIITLSILSSIELWQRKEYRFDRIRSFLNSDESKYYTLSYIVSTTTALTAWSTAFFNSLLFSQILTYIGLSTITAYYLANIWRQGISRPKPTVKASINTVTALLFILSYLSYCFEPSIFLSLQWLTLIIITPTICAITVILINIPFALKKKQLIFKAKKRRETLSQLKTIGVTGSLGKTSAKHFLYQILQLNNERVLVTDKRRNSEIAVAQDMLKQLNKDTDVYIAEMGAYRKQEIKKLADLTKPEIGVITNITNQHLALFGSLETISKTKWELIDSLPENGIAVLNKDSKTIIKMAKDIKLKTIWYSTQEETDVYAKDIVIHDTYIQATIVINTEKKNIRLNLAGDGAVTNVLAAIAAALAYGLTAKQILTIIPKIKGVSHTMEILKHNDITVIDDSYSANLKGVLSAIKHLDKFTNPNKLIVLTPLIELGKDSAKAHHKIGKALSHSNAQIIILGKNNRKDILSGIKEEGHQINISFIAKPKKALKKIKSVIHPDMVVLLEGRAPNIIQQYLTKKK